MRQRLGQHFLTNTSVLKKITEVLDPQTGETTIEIGPGHGELTAEIIARCELLGTKKNTVIVIERDPELASSLKTKFRDIEVIEGDVLEVLPALSSKLKAHTYKLVGNIPYYLTGFLLRTIGELPHKPTRTLFTIQKEVAQRIAATPPQMNRLAAAVQIWADPKIIGFISKKDFSPPPEVDSATILLESKNGAPSGAVLEAYEEALNALFKQPRKTVGNNLLSAVPISRAELVDNLKSIGIDPESRPQNISIQDIHKIAELLVNWG